MQIQDVAAAYDRKYSADGFRSLSSSYRLALTLLDTKPGETLLDIACGMGDTMEQATSRQLRAVAIDLSFEAVRITKSRVTSAQAFVANAQNLPFPAESFDHVTLLGSLEHLLDPGECLLEVRRVLKWGGSAAILVPNSYYLPDIVWLVLRTGYGPNHKQLVERFATAQEWRVFIESGGLKVERIRKWNFQVPRTPDDWTWYRSNPRRWLGLAAAPFLPLNLSYSFIYRCVKDPASKGQTFEPLAWPPPPKLVSAT